MKINLKGSTIQPGDKIILTSPDHLTLDRAASIKRLVESELPGVTAVVLGGVEVAAVHRPEHGAKETR